MRNDIGFPWAHALTMLLVWALCAAYLAAFSDRSWIPSDDGTLAFGAERVLRGETPHRDFDAVYTGGLDYVHAFAFRVGGVRLLTLRRVILGFSIAAVPVIYWIAARAAPPGIAALVTLASVAWSFPNYPAAMPSWYQLVAALFGVAALLRHLDTGRTRWLVVAGLVAGLAALAKSTGVYLVAAWLLHLVRAEQVAAVDRGPRSRGYLGWLCAAALAFLSALTWLLRPQLSTMAFFQYLLPPAAIWALLLRDEARAGTGPPSARLAALARLVLPFAAGVAVPLAVFSIPYWPAGGLGDLVRGVLTLPRLRLQTATLELPPLGTLAASAPVALLLLFPSALARAPRAARIGTAAALAAVLAAGASPAVYGAVWHAARPVVPWVVIGGCLHLARAAGAPERKRGLELLLLLATVALFNLLQYPFAFALYFCFVAPLAILAAAHLCLAQPRAPRALQGALLVFSLLFAVFWMNRGHILNIGRNYIHYPPLRPLVLERGGIRVPVWDAERYSRIVALVQAHAGPGEAILAAPDCPEIYFLADRRNPGRTIGDLFDPDYADPPARRARILDTLRRERVNVVVINDGPTISGPMEEGLRREIVRLFPEKEAFMQFEVRWRP